MSLVYVGQQLTIYFGFFLIIIGVLGNGLNILIFSTVRTYRTTPCTFYFLMASIFKLSYIAFNLTSRIASSGFGTDLTRTSIIWCKLRTYSLVTLSLMALSCSCLATIDQFLITSQTASIRRFSHLKYAYRSIPIVIIIWCLYAIPGLIYYNISSVTKTCLGSNTGYVIFTQIYLFGLLSTIPTAIMLLFGYLTYRNIRLTRALAEQRADRQLIRIVLIETILVMINYLPYGINTAYGLLTSTIAKDADRSMKENFATTVFNLTSYFYYTGSCYAFLLTSSRFRRSVKDRIFFWQRNNQILPHIQTNTRGQVTLDN